MVDGEDPAHALVEGRRRADQRGAAAARPHQAQVHVDRERLAPQRGLPPGGFNVRRKMPADDPHADAALAHADGGDGRILEVGAVQGVGQAQERRGVEDPVRIGPPRDQAPRGFGLQRRRVQPDEGRDHRALRRREAIEPAVPDQRSADFRVPPGIGGVADIVQDGRGLEERPVRGGDPADGVGGVEQLERQGRHLVGMGRLHLATGAELFDGKADGGGQRHGGSTLDRDQEPPPGRPQTQLPQCYIAGTAQGRGRKPPKAAKQECLWRTSSRENPTPCMTPS